MKRIASIACAVALLSGSSLLAQPSNSGAPSGQIKVKKGAKIHYKVDMSIDINQSMMGQEVSMTMSSIGDAELKATNVARSLIDWTYSLQKMKMKMTGPMMPTGMDTTINSPPSTFTTDLQGNITKQEGLQELSEAMSGGIQTISLEQYFSPVLGRSLKPGDTWEVSRVDTTPQGGIDVRINTTMKYTYHGTVDTMKTKAVRISSEITSMTLEGEGNQQGMDIIVDGDGNGTNTFYYSQKDGLLLAAVSNSEINARASVTGQAAMVIPMTYVMKSTLVRK